MKQIAQGAEAKLFLDKNEVIKHRFKKEYRIKEIDKNLRKSRTRREAKMLDKLSIINFPAPRLKYCDEKEKIEMEFIQGKLIKNVLDKGNYKQLCGEIGKKIAILHNNDIIHGDLTTSNLIQKDEIFFIDFGLSFFSKRIEDKAVDLRLLKQALESKHYKIWDKCYNTALESYEKECKSGKEVIKRLGQVENRGRYKNKNRH